MKILFYCRGVESLGVGYLMSVLKSDGHDVRLVFDPGLDDNSHLKLSALAFLNRYKRIIKKAKSFAPDLVAVSSPSNLFPYVRRFMSILCRHVHAPFVIGGVHATILPEYVLKTTPASYVCVGEGENVMRSLARSLEEGNTGKAIPGLWIKRDDELEKNPVGPVIEDLDSIPFPEKMPFFRYGCFRSRISVLTSRGCPFHCSYCSNDILLGVQSGSRQGIRKRTHGNVIRELQLWKETFPVRSFWFCDDVFGLDKKWLNEFVEDYLEIGPLPFDCHMHPNVIDQERISLLKKARCRHIFVGVDSGDERIRSDIMGRPMSEEHIRENVRLIKENGIRLTISAMFGLPGEGPEEMRKTIDLCTSLESDGTSAYIYYPFYGTKLFEYSRQQGLLSEKQIELIKQGEGSYHRKSIVKHPYGQLAYTYSKLTPLYTCAPKYIRFLLNFLLKRRAFRSATLLHTFTVPFVYPIVGTSWLADTFRMAWKVNRA